MQKRYRWICPRPQWASRDIQFAGELQELRATSGSGPTSTPPGGVEIAASVKNALRLPRAADGLGFGDNTRAALMTRGLAEMARLGCAVGADQATFSGLPEWVISCHVHFKALPQSVGRGLAKDIHQVRSSCRWAWLRKATAAPAVWGLARDLVATCPSRRMSCL